MKLQDFEKRSINLLTSRGILPAKHDAAERFAGDFIAYGWLYHSKFGTGDVMLDLLEDNANLNPGDCFNTNFSGNLRDLIVKPLLDNTTFAELLNVLVNNKAKGVGVGELVLPLLIANWRFSNDSDGIHNGEKKEIKMNGASLKPVATGVTEKGLIDTLNAKYFNGLKPGLDKVHQNHVRFIHTLKEHDRLTTYIDYFTNLYPGKDVKTMSRQLLENIENLDVYNTILGKNVMRWYKETDEWTSIVIIDPITLDLVNVADIDSVNTEGNVQLVFRPVMSRGRDTQAVPDGYVNVSIAKDKKSKKSGKKKFEELYEEVKTPEEILAELEEKQSTIEADNKFIGFLTDPSDPLTQAWRKVDKDDKVDARDFIVEMIKEGIANAVIATTVVKSFC